MLLAGSAEFSVLMVRRPPAGMFGDAWVFPGGVLDEADGSGQAGHRLAAVRELEEEVGIDFDPEDLVYLSRWVTPITAAGKVLPRRYDTCFYLASLPEPLDVRPLTPEIADARFVTPAAAIDSHRSREWTIVLPTLAHLRWLEKQGSVSAALAAAPMPT